jgi:lipopolysaccharide/colanic/teichoic acid biosynthesis glycosyltransferase
MTDLASLWNFHEGEVLKGSKDPDKDYQEKIWPTKKKLQIEYIKKQSFWLDIKIILKTIFKIFK